MLRTFHALVAALGMLTAPLLISCVNAPACTGSGCPCDTDAACEAGDVCQAGTCRTPFGSSLTVDDPAVRSCEIVLNDPDGAIESVTFASTVMGGHLRRGPHVAISFVQREDLAFPGNSLALELEASASTVNVTVVSSQCFDRLGQPRPTASINLGS